jgi:hypothetical protein
MMASRFTFWPNVLLATHSFVSIYFYYNLQETLRCKSHSGNTRTATEAHRPFAFARWAALVRRCPSKSATNRMADFRSLDIDRSQVLHQAGRVTY